MKNVFETYYGVTPELTIGKCGKPILSNAPLHFNLSHSGSLTALAVSDRPVGLDAEQRDGREYAAIAKRLTARERREDFLMLWTAKEAYVKYLGEALAAQLPTLEYCGGTLFQNGKPLPICLFQTVLAGYALTACTGSPEHASLVCCD